jgi:very-short-patch-repair endonuclease
MSKLLYNTWLYKQPKRKKKKRKVKSTIEKYADKLQKNTPKSEVWFLTHYKPHRFDSFNVPFGPFIPDVINKRLRYVIEIDGSIHNLKEVMFNDWKKDQYYKKRYYKVFRVKAYDIESLNKFLIEYQDHLSKLTT